MQVCLNVIIVTFSSDFFVFGRKLLAAINNSGEGTVGALCDGLVNYSKEKSKK